MDVRASEEVAESPSSLLGIMASHEIVNVPGEQPTCNPRAGTPASEAALGHAEKELAAVMRPRGKEWEQRFRLPLPGARQTVVFLSASGASAARCAATAASLGYMRCAVVEGGLAALAASARLPPPSKLASTLLSRDALAVLLERLGSGLSSLLLLDVRRPDERTLYGAIAGSLSVPVEQLPRALAMGPDEWMRTFRFARPQPQQPLVFISRKDLRGRWAAQLACDAGFSRCLVLERGTSGWRLDAGVNVYDAYSDGEAPPEPQRFLVEAADMSHGEIEMRKLISNGII